MPIFDLFSKRQKKNRGETKDILVHTEFPENLRIQIIQIWDELIRNISISFQSNPYEKIVNILRHEYGVFHLLGNANSYVSPEVELREFFLLQDEIDKVLDIVEVVFVVLTESSPNFFGFDHCANSAISELNQRFLENGVGFQFSSNQIVRIDSTYLHSETIKPALSLLSEDAFAGANEEFLKAHEHYRKGNHKESLNECSKALESVMKVICIRRSWISQNDALSASKLIETCLDNELIPRFWQNYFSALEQLLKSGTPTVRNKISAHGQGTQITSAPNFMVSYIIHMTASSIVFLVSADKHL